MLLKLKLNKLISLMKTFKTNVVNTQTYHFLIVLLHFNVINAFDIYCICMVVIRQNVMLLCISSCGKLEIKPDKNIYTPEIGNHYKPGLPPIPGESVA